MVAFDDWSNNSSVKKNFTPLNQEQKMKVLETFIDMRNQNTLKFKLFDIFSLKEAEKEALASQIRIYLSQKKSDIFRAADVIQYFKLQDNFSFVSYFYIFNNNLNQTRTTYSNLDCYYNCKTTKNLLFQSKPVKGFK